MTIPKKKMEAWRAKQAEANATEIEAQRKTDEEIRRMNLERRVGEEIVQMLSHLAYNEIHFGGEDGTLKKLIELGVLSYESAGNYCFFVDRTSVMANYYLDGKPLYFTKVEYASQVFGELVEKRLGVFRMFDASVEE